MTATITIDDLRARLRHAGEAVGAGRFSLALHQDRSAACSVLHWLPADDPRDGEECHEVGYGSAAECLAALDRYVESHRR